MFCEPASAASVAALLEAARDGLVEPGACVVCVLTGHGLKDPDVAIENAPAVISCDVDLAQVERAVLGD